MITQVYKRDGTFQNFDVEKITKAIFKAARACGGNDEETARNLANEVVETLEKSLVQKFQPLKKFKTALKRF